MAPRTSKSNRTSMSLGEAVRIAMASLWAHKMRSVLTLLGVVIGVTSVIAVVSLVNGLNRYVAEKIFNLGADVFLINRGPSIITNIDQWEASQKRQQVPFRRLRSRARRVPELRRRGRDPEPPWAR